MNRFKYIEGKKKKEEPKKTKPKAKKKAKRKPKPDDNWREVRANGARIITNSVRSCHWYGTPMAPITRNMVCGRCGQGDVYGQGRQR